MAGVKGESEEVRKGGKVGRQNKGRGSMGNCEESGKVGE